MSLVSHMAEPIAAPPVRDLADHLVKRATRPLLNRLSIALFALVVVATMVCGLVKPDYNWDMAPYIAVSLEDRISDPVTLHAEAWKGITAEAPESQVYELSQGNPYNAELWVDAEEFVSQLSMYRVKVGYVEAMRLLDRVVSPVMATQIISVGSALVVGLLTMIWMVRAGTPQALLLLAPALLLAGYFKMTTVATPDLFMAAFGLIGIYLITRGRAWLAVPFVFAAFLVRPDGIIFLFAWLLASVAFGTMRLPALLTFLAAVAAYLPIAEAANHPGWWPHFYFSNYELQNDMTGFAPPFDLAVYIHGIARGIGVSLRANNWPMLMGVLLVAWALLAVRGRAPGKFANLMLVTLVLTLIGKFVTFPLPDDRVYFMFVAGFMLILCEAWKPDFTPKTVEAQGT